MRTRMAVVVIAVVVALGNVKAAAQSRFDVGLLLSSTNATDEGAVLQFDRGTTYQVTFAWLVWRTGGAQLSVEVPFIASPAFTVVPPRAAVPLEYASLYLTPGLARHCSAEKHRFRSSAPSVVATRATPSPN
jgi:hypothetical protein